VSSRGRRLPPRFGAASEVPSGAEIDASTARFKLAKASTRCSALKPATAASQVEKTSARIESTPSIRASLTKSTDNAIRAK
jgi:hypothetical protein